MTSLARSHPPIHRPQLPDGVRIYAISDIHGCSHLLQPMLRVIDADLAHSRPRYAIEVFMGDYVDRGPDTRATLDLLVERSRRGNSIFLKGNHEAFSKTRRCLKIGFASVAHRRSCPMDSRRQT